MTVSLTFASILTAANVSRVLLEFTVNDEVTNENVVLPLSGGSKPSKTNTKFLLNFGVQQIYLFILCYVMLYYAMSCHVMSCQSPFL